MIPILLFLVLVTTLFTNGFPFSYVGSRVSVRKLYESQKEETDSNSIFNSLFDLFIEPNQANQNSRKVGNRSYAANKASFSRNPPYTLDDLDYVSVSATKLRTGSSVYIVAKYGILLLLGWFTFPIIVKIIEPLSNESTVTVATSINGVSVLFGTLISITYSILFNRQSQLQDAATKESATLSYLTRAISDFFDMNSHIFSVNDKMDHLQCIWQHCVTLVGKSRGYELVQILEDDPLLKLQSMLQTIEIEADTRNSSPSSSISSVATLAPGSESSLNRIRDQIVLVHDQVTSLLLFPSLNVSLTHVFIHQRAARIGQESVVLPVIHFYILTALSAYQLMGFVSISVTAQKTVDTFNYVGSQTFFSILLLVYVLSISFALDLNKPFMGVYQIRRSAISAYLLQIKELMYYNNLKILEDDDSTKEVESQNEYIDLNIEVEMDPE